MDGKNTVFGSWQNLQVGYSVAADSYLPALVNDCRSDTEVMQFETFLTKANKFFFEIDLKYFVGILKWKKIVY